LAGYLPVTLFAGLFYFIFGGAGLFYLLKPSLGEEPARVAALSTAAGTVVLGGFCYVRFVINRLSQTRLSLEDEVLVVRGQTSAGLVEKRYAVSDIDAVAFGEQLNAAERAVETLHRLGLPNRGAVWLLKDLKAGRLLITDKHGGHEVFHFVDKVFDQEALAEFAAQLRCRGIAVTGPS
jgi:hypothetical protein